MSRKHKGGGHGDVHADERWLVTYADMITLLLAVFIVMYALSDISLRKFNDFAQSLSAAFNTDVFAGTSQFTVSAGVETAPEAGSQQSGVGFVSGTTTAVKTAISSAAIAHGLGDKVSVSVENNNVTVNIQTDGVMFAPGRARLLSTDILQFVGDSIKYTPGIIQIWGHTDDQSPTGGLYGDNFELSVARSMAVMAYLRDTVGIGVDRLRVGGAAEWEPKAPNDTEANRAKNRYVSIVLTLADPNASASPTIEPLVPTLQPILGE